MYNKSYKPLFNNVDDFIMTENEIPKEMVFQFIDKKMKQSGGDGYTFDVNRSIGGLVGRSRYSYNYAPIYYGELLEPSVANKNTVCKAHQTGGGCGCQSKSPQSIYELLKIQSGGRVKKSQFEAIHHVGRGLAVLSINSLINLVLLLFLYESVVDKGVDKKEIKKAMQKWGNAMTSIIAPLGRGNLLVLAALLLLHHFAVEKPKSKKSMRGGNDIYEKLNEILKPLGQKNGLSVMLTDLYNSFTQRKTNEQEGGSVLKSLIAPLGTNAFIATGLLLILKRVFIENRNKVKKGGSKKDFDSIVNLLGPISFNAFANENIFKNKALKQSKKS